ncbi:MMPL family transporter [Mycobacterium sp. OTB74]|uniref:MMPL family transporter n=1 Tax=Mycobacterium sp. OTB74 TaxID=1853452 RepID=UPI002475D2E5|nr:MMPL family transporter [Mycobacterium sp. OTB74]MDH6243430.1 putative membrane protein YdfJ with MMPL/SSD domain [Mycobacterium sp. OTB74]
MMRLSGTLRRWRWAVFAVWLLLMVPSLYLAATQSSNLSGGGFEVAGSQSLHVQYQLEDHFPDQGASPLALVAAPNPGASQQDMTAAVDRLERIAADTTSVKVVRNTQQPPPQSGRPYVVTLQLDFNNSGAVDIAKKLRAAVGINGEKPGQSEDGKVRFYVIGQGALGAAASQATKHDIAAAEKWNLPIVLIVLLAVFGSLAAATMPLVFGLCTVVVTLGVVYLLSIWVTMSVFVTSTVSMFGIALAVDYSLFILMRFREELRAGRDTDQAADAAMATSGLAVLLSGLTVIASITGIYLIDTPVLSSMATGAILAVAIAVLTSTSLTPAVLATFGRRVAKRSPWLHVTRRPDTTQSRFWTRWTDRTMHRPWLSALLAATLLVIMAAPAFSMELGNSMLRQFEPTHEIRGGVSAAAEALGPGALGPVRVLVTFPDATASDPQRTAVLDAVHQTLTQAPDVVTVAPPVFGNDNRSALFSTVLSVDPEDMVARDSIKWMRQHLPNVVEPETTVDVGGPTALIMDFDVRVAATQGLVFVFVAVIAFVMLLISIRSVVLAFKGVLMTVLSVAAAYGSLVAVFQWGWLQSLGFKPLESLDSTIPPLVLAMTFGLSMDYEIFLLTRIRERFLQSGDTRDSVTYGVSTSARTITSAALIMIAVFIGFAFAGMPLVAQMGVACAVAIAVDATVVRLVLVPALMAMFDQWNWWVPQWLDRILPSVDFEKPLPKAETGNLVIIPEEFASLADVAPSGAELRTVVRSAAKLKHLAPQTINVSDPLAFSGCMLAGQPIEMTLSGSDVPRTLKGGPRAVPRRIAPASTDRRHDGRKPSDRDGDNTVRSGVAVLRRTSTDARPADGVRPVTLWGGRLSVALDALSLATDTSSIKRLSPMETTNVLLPTGDRLEIPTGAETLRLKSYLVMCRNSAQDYSELADLVSYTDVNTAAAVLTGMDQYYSGHTSQSQWVATQLVRRLADPHPFDDNEPGGSGTGDWVDVKERCLAVAVAMLEETR